MDAQIPAIGPTPLIAELFIGSLLYSTVNEARSVLRFVVDTDVDEPAVSVLAAARALALRGTPPSPQLVHDELKRHGNLTKSTAVWLNAATTSGACSSAVTDYAGALVAQSFRTKIESFGHALTCMSETASEAEIGALVENAVARIRGIGARLEELRGDA